MSKKKHDIIYIDTTGSSYDINDNDEHRVIFIGENKILKKIKFNKIFLPVLFFLLVSTVLISGYKVYLWFDEGKEAIKDTSEYVVLANITEDEDIKEETVVKNDKTVKKSNVNNTYYWKFDNVKLMNVNFNKLSKINNEIVAWLKVPGTNINYPVTQTNNNTFYLNHTFDRSKNGVGWIFLDYRNNGDLTNRNNVIYGHGRVDNVMFGTLENVLNESWFKNEKNRFIKTSTPTHNDVWEVFSVYVIEAESFYLQTGFVDDLDFLNFINIIKSRSKFDFDTMVSTSDKILTLSTCYSEKKRIVLHARLLVTEDKITKEKYNIEAIPVIEKELTIKDGIVLPEEVQTQEIIEENQNQETTEEINEEEKASE